MLQELDSEGRSASADQPVTGGRIAAEPELNEKKTKAQKKREVREQRIMDGLAEFRTASREISEAYLASLETSIDQVASSIRDRQQTTGKKGAIKGQALKQMSALIDGLSVKPNKGRRKDLKRIELTVAELLRLVQGRKGK